MIFKSFTESRSLVLWLICLGGMALVALHAYQDAAQISELLLEADNDDQMRLLAVRDLLAGQSWWDTRQYRVLPPEGISMHWSRYIDAGIAGIVLVASNFVSVTSAELAAVILWPSFLAGLMILVLGHGTARILGTASAIGALAVFLSWAKLGGQFVPPRIDHHNVQILCATALFYLSLVPGRALVLGALGGVVTAFALAVGLEMLPYYATIWGLMALRHAFGQANTGHWLLGFGAAIVPSALLFFAGQTPMATWGTPWCDVLATPVMALGLVGVVATLVPVLGERLLTSPLSRISVMLGLAALGIWLAFPLLGQCLAGPYSDLSPEMRSIIDDNITEALSASKLLAESPSLLGRILLPAVVIGFLALITLWRMRSRISTLQATALMQAFVVLGLGLGFALTQIRAAQLMTPAVPLLGGFLVYAFTLIPRENWFRLPAMVVLLLAIPTVVEKAAHRILYVPKPVTSANASVNVPFSRKNCRTETALAEIARVPPALMFSTINLGPSIITYTHHSATSASYHRSVDALWNGLGAFTTDDLLRAAVAKSGADYLVLCAGSRIERDNPLTSAIVAGDLPNWLTDVTVDRSEVRLLKIDKTSLAGISP
ncbi:hypothetical protein [Tabrizicola sp.]|uniref:hypothetical protein n=1 Tax=Tabrizicola sp. TaxID=2005166 RepID=UPI003F3BDBE9